MTRTMMAIAAAALLAPLAANAQTTTTNTTNTTTYESPEEMNHSMNRPTAAVQVGVGVANFDRGLRPSPSRARAIQRAAISVRRGTSALSSATRER